ncbi:hypothetical protein K504DRAFT_449991 [Pleomassaria siparia CBS 279.74]|uniref:Uncharacterized protein n=1 Tax=Pleomassaria siparia CBS 279.74 TaxID=1314801 RepID=A0A6G1KKA7_9PLEO|nr:hypothetical protein K504DRAFT_449991 [Pleomassaria siparia CBS 279.74]
MFFDLETAAAAFPAAAAAFPANQSYNKQPELNTDPQLTYCLPVCLRPCWPHAYPAVAIDKDRLSFMPAKKGVVVGRRSFSSYRRLINYCCHTKKKKKKKKNHALDWILY